MGWFVPGAIIFLIGVIALVVATRFAKEEAKREAEGGYGNQAEAARGAKRLSRIIGVSGIGLGLLLASFSTVYFQSVGEAKVVVNADGTVAGTDLDAGMGFKAPWQNTVDFDTFSQELVYAGGDTAPSYTGGTVNGKEITVAVGGVNGGSTQAFVDLTVVYSLTDTKVLDIYEDWRSQERFTKSVIEKNVLSVARQIPAQYTAIEFRGEKRAEASTKLEQALADKLEPLGVSEIMVTIQDVRFKDSVEAALQEVENANQAVQKAEAEQNRIEVEAESARIKAEGEAQARIAAAQGEAEANRLIAQSLTPEVLQQRQIDAMKEGTVYVVPQGSTPFIGTR